MQHHRAGYGGWAERHRRPDSRETVIERLRKELTSDKKTFLVSLKAGEPNWSVMGIKGIEKLPAIQWKLMNIRKISAKKRAELLDKLKRTLGW